MIYIATSSIELHDVNGSHPRPAVAVSMFFRKHPKPREETARLPMSVWKLDARFNSSIFKVNLA